MHLGSSGWCMKPNIYMQMIWRKTSQSYFEVMQLDVPRLITSNSEDGFLCWTPRAEDKRNTEVMVLKETMTARGICGTIILPRFDQVHGQ